MDEASKYRTWQSMSYNATHGADVEIIWDRDTGGYDWEIVSLVRRLKGDIHEYAVYAWGGCSCSSPYEDGPEKYDLAWTGSLVEATDRALREIDSMYDLNTGDRIEAKSSLRQAVYRL